ncbi:MAG: PspA/IM30 family protein [Candidatus Dormibacteria bacterium]
MAAFDSWLRQLSPEQVQLELSELERQQAKLEAGIRLRVEALHLLNAATRCADSVGEGQAESTAALDRTEDPIDALDRSYQKQLEALQKVRQSVAEVLTSEKRLEMRQAGLQQTQEKSQGQAALALQQGREDLAHLALARGQQAQAQGEELQRQIAQLKDVAQQLEVTAHTLTAKVESFRTQREIIKAQYSAASASTQIEDS